MLRVEFIGYPVSVSRLHVLYPLAPSHSVSPHVLRPFTLNGFSSSAFPPWIPRPGLDVKALISPYILTLDVLNKQDEKAYNEPLANNLNPLITLWLRLEPMIVIRQSANLKNWGQQIWYISKLNIVILDKKFFYRSKRPRLD